MAVAKKDIGTLTAQVRFHLWEDEDGTPFITWGVAGLPPRAMPGPQTGSTDDASSALSGVATGLQERLFAFIEELD